MCILIIVVKQKHFTNMKKEVQPQAIFMEKNLIYTEMLDIYKGLLTEKQAEAMEYYYDRDYSLGEISEIMDISRQGVRDFIKRGEAVMDEMEAKLNLVETFRRIAEIEECASRIKAVNKQFSQNREIDALSDEILGKIQFIENGAE